METSRLNIALLIGVAILSLQGCDNDNKNSAKKNIPEIKVSTLKSTAIVPFQSFIGRTAAINEVSIVPRVEGELVKIDVADGQAVKKGDLLYEIDPRPYAAALQSAQAKQAEAQASLAMSRSNKIRAEKLAVKSLISMEELENRKTEFAKMVADYNMAKADVALAQLNLGFTQIRSPLTGQVGYSNYKVGDRIIITLKNKLTTVVQTSPILFDFDIDEKLYRKIRNSLDRANKNQDDLDLSLQLSDGDVYPEKGRIVAIDNKINSATGTIHVQASFPNESQKLVVGEYGKLLAKLKNMTVDGVIVPQSAIMQDQKGSYVFVIDGQHKASIRYIHKGQPYGSNVAIDDGLVANETIALSGLSKLRNGTEVKAIQ